ncbi:hypothetical protein D9753_22405 [Streptomyces dangxiongensis]|uniref:Uncharacterized protein n=1 Tax=Streptomyces dangxiongensis TaxID=1442032 RepID=A0A3G2JHU1_9ACTN|nr:hypothetical protein [Streptomyces dangxiongensis]AYN41171.1 hypothetical protein D9753_22405 [Streptomyces dangxiongensis]
MTVQIAEELARLHRLISWYDVPQQSADGRPHRRGLRLVLDAGRQYGRASGADRDSPAEMHGLLRGPARLVHQLVRLAQARRGVHRLPAAAGRYVGHGRRVPHELTIGPADKEAPFCIICVKAPSAAEPTVPVRWEGLDRLYLSCAHAVCASSRWAAR